MLPRTSLHILKLLREFHGGAIGEHSSVLKTYQRLAVELYWARMKKDVEEMVVMCDVLVPQIHSNGARMVVAAIIATR